MPTTTEIKSARIESDMTQAEAADLVHSDIRTWRRWENGERNMSPAVWELFRLKSGQLKIDN